MCISNKKIVKTDKMCCKSHKIPHIKDISEVLNDDDKRKLLLEITFHEHNTKDGSNFHMKRPTDVIAILQVKMAAVSVQSTHLILTSDITTKLALTILPMERILSSR